MISYNPKDWFTFIFRFHKSDTFRELLPMIVAISVYSAAICWVETGFLKMDGDSRLKNLSQMHSMLSFVISMLLVFRTNSAYERWWEGRKLWGALMNNSRNLALKVHALAGDDSRFLHFMGSMIGNYAYALKSHLRNTFHPQDMEENDRFVTSEVQHDRHNPNHIAKRMFEVVQQKQKEGGLSNEQLLYLNGELSSFTDICGACERIKNTPIPFSYSIFIKKFIFFYVMTLPLTMVFSLGYYCVPVVAFIFYVLTSLELIAEEIEEPFGKDENDLPMDAMSRNIRKSVYEILDLPLKTH